MKRILIYTIALSVGLLIFGCAEAPRSFVRDEPQAPRRNLHKENSDYLNEALPAWLGHDAAELILAWGKPNEAHDFINLRGEKWISFSYGYSNGVSLEKVPQYTVSRTVSGDLEINDTSTIRIPLYYHVYFTANRDGVLVRANWNGTDASELDPIKHPMPSKKAETEFQLRVSSEPSDVGGSWRLLSPLEVREESLRANPDNILNQLEKNR